MTHAEIIDQLNKKIEGLERALAAKPPHDDEWCIYKIKHDEMKRTCEFVLGWLRINSGLSSVDAIKKLMKALK
jgi:hypothetical protein